MMVKINSLWVEKYRPETLENYIGNTMFKESVAKYLRKNDLPNLILHGPTGTGKTTAAKIILKNINCDYLYINASDDNGIDTVRESIRNFAAAAIFKPLKIVVYDDTHNLTVDAQNSLLNIIETYSKKTRFIFTTNHIGKLIPALRSRCVEFCIEPPSKKDVANHLVSILSEEEVTFEASDIIKIVMQFYPDIRSCVKILQECINDEKILALNFDNLANSAYLYTIVEILKKPGANSWKQIREILNDTDLTDYTNVFTHLYNTADQFALKGYEETIFAISQAQYQQYFVPNKEINAAEMFLKILKVIQ